MDYLHDVRLGFVGSRSAFVDSFGAVWTEAGLARPLSLWGQHCRSLTVALSLAPVRQPLHDHVLPAQLVQFLPLPWMPSLASGFHRIGPTRRTIREVERRSDAVIVQIPFEAPLALLGARTPRLYHLIHDIWGVARHSSQYRGWKRVPALAVGGAIDRLQRGLLHRADSRTVANGAEILAHYSWPPGRSVVSATMLQDEIMSVRRLRRADAPFRVLFVGTFRREKGIDTLLDAFGLLLDRAPNAELEIVGAPHTVDRQISAEMERALEALGQEGRVRLAGRRAFGPELFQCFADADVLAMPSRAEGTPRVLLEARAFGCPVVATPVGGVPSSVTDQHDGLLIPPDDPLALMEALLRIKNDCELRARLVKNGLDRARRTTVEVFAQSMAEELMALLPQVPAPAYA